MSVPDPLITTSPDRLSGTPVFAGTRVPVPTLVDYLEAGDSLDDFLADFPSVSREHAIAVLELAKSARQGSSGVTYGTWCPNSTGWLRTETPCQGIAGARGSNSP